MSWGYRCSMTLQVQHRGRAGEASSVSSAVVHIKGEQVVSESPTTD